MPFSLDAKEQVKQATDIVDLAGSYLQLRREGRRYNALCPWHDDTRPSLQIDPQRQSFKCYVCDLGGDVFSFLMQIESVTFPEAVAMLAERAGITITQSTGGGTGASSSEEKRTLYQAMAWAEQQFCDCLLKSPAAEAARLYLDGRGISEESISRFRLGFSPESWDWLLKSARDTRFTGRVLEQIGLVRSRDRGQGYYDWFRGRVLFSIRDPQGRPVGLGGRVLPGGDDKTAKYVNSPETPLFAKSKLLYGLDIAREGIQESHTALVMEGYTDCVMAHQAGVNNAVAVLGTALNENHVRLLRRYADRIVLVLDGDEAGRRRANQVLELFVAEQVDLRILTLPQGLDPCDFLLEHGAAALVELADAAVDALEHKRRIAVAGVEQPGQTHQLNQALEDVLAVIAKAPRLSDRTTTAAKLKEDQILNRLSREFAASEASVRGRLSALRNTRRRRVAEPESNADESRGDQQIDPWERELLALLIQRPHDLQNVLNVVRPEHFSPGPCQEIFSRCCVLAAAGSEASFDRLMLEIEDPQLKSTLVDLDDVGSDRNGQDSARQLQDVLDSYRRRLDTRHRRSQTAALREGRLNDERGEELLKDIIQSERTRQGISGPTDGQDASSVGLG